MEQCYQTSPGKHKERIKPAASWESSSAPLPRAMDLKVVCALSVTLVIALSTLAEGNAPPSKYIHLLLPSRYVWDPHPTDCSQSLPALTDQTAKGFLCCCLVPKWSLLLNVFSERSTAKCERLQVNSCVGITRYPLQRQRRSLEQDQGWNRNQLCLNRHLAFGLCCFAT